MKKISAFLMAVFFVTAAYADPIPAAITNWLKIYQTKSITLQKGVLSITMDRPKVTREIYGSVVIDGVCMSLLDQPTSWGKANIKQIEVVNSFGVQGYVFKGGPAECKVIGQLNSNQIARDFLPDRTRMK